MWEVLPVERIRIVSDVPDWREAVRLACEALSLDDLPTESIAESILQNVEANGGTGIISPYAILPQGSPISGATERAVSAVLSRRPFYVAHARMPIRLLVLIAAAEPHEHLDLRKQVLHVLNDRDRLDRILSSPDARAVHREFTGGEA